MFFMYTFCSFGFFKNFDYKFISMIILEIIFILVFSCIFLFSENSFFYLIFLLMMVCESCFGLIILINYIRGVSKVYFMGEIF